MFCPFCNPTIIQKQSIYQNDLVFVLYNIRPANKGQCLVVPKRHVENIRELDTEELSSLMMTMQRVSTKLNHYIKPNGFNYGFNEGSYAGQIVNHFHFHIMPRFENDSLPEFHLFHRDPKTKRDLTDSEIEPFVEEFKKLLEPSSIFE